MKSNRLEVVIAIRVLLSEGIPLAAPLLRRNPGAGFNGTQMIYYFILGHIQTTKNIIKLETNLQQPRRIYARKSHLRAIESNPGAAPKRRLRLDRVEVAHEKSRAQ